MIDYNSCDMCGKMILSDKLIKHGKWLVCKKCSQITIKEIKKKRFKGGY